MISFPNAKVNLGLNILAKRPDGYHEISSCLYPIPWCDILEVVPSEKLSFSQTGLKIDGDPMNNLCVKAYEVLAKDFELPPVSIHLHKVIPMGAGLGGGSSDGTFCLKAISQIFNLGLSIAELETYAAVIGSDCPFFVKNIPSIATGTGTSLKPIDLDFDVSFIGVIYPDVHVSTQQAYSGTTPKTPVKVIEEIIPIDIKEWQDLLYNDFEKSVFHQFPKIKDTKDKMIEAGAIYASMSGSGSAVFGLFESEPKALGFDFLGDIRQLETLQDF